MPYQPVNPESSHIREEYQSQQELFNAQPAIVQRFLESQARIVASALTGHLPQVHFTLPDRVVAMAPQVDQQATMTVPAKARDQQVGNLRNRVLGKEVRDQLRNRLAELEQSPDLAIATSASLVRHATAIHMIYSMLPSGRSVVYRPDEDDLIPTIPVDSAADPESAITADTDAIAEEGGAENGRGNLQVPFVPFARKFFLPQWVAFDDQGKLLVNSLGEAEAHVASMQQFLTILFIARSLTPYIISDEEFQKKRYGMLGQLINQGRALAMYKTGEIIRTIKERAAAGSLNRGLGISLPYFDDQILEVKKEEIQVIPAGRIMFIPAFMVRAAREEQAKISQDTRLSPSTRKHLLRELTMLETAFGQENK